MLKKIEKKKLVKIFYLIKEKKFYLRSYNIIFCLKDFVCSLTFLKKYFKESGL